MPPGSEPLLAAVCAAPWDDLPRLAVADWLDDHGDPARAEFIRLQCVTVGVRKWDPSRRRGRRAAGRRFGRWPRQTHLVMLTDRAAVTRAGSVHLLRLATVRVDGVDLSDAAEQALRRLGEGQGSTSPPGPLSEAERGSKCVRVAGVGDGPHGLAAGPHLLPLSVSERGPGGEVTPPARR